MALLTLVGAAAPPMATLSNSSRLSFSRAESLVGASLSVSFPATQSQPAVPPMLALFLLLSISTSHASLDEAPERSLASTDFFKEIVEEIAAKELWDLKTRIRILSFDAGSALLGDSQRYEFQIRLGRGGLTVRFSEVELWRQLESVDELDLGTQGGVVEDLELEGPLDVHVGGGDGELTLRLPVGYQTLPLI